MKILACLPIGRQAVPTEGGAGRGVIGDLWVFSEIPKLPLDNNRVFP